ncbi:hypothetical protein GGQ84_002551 [Desulfitispora alkaliphila]|uniref:DUF554 domain-containing protein n=1 Tax=Desulfitispora alkaliphila TaxID=622674 RepID=UPI003D202E97
MVGTIINVGAIITGSLLGWLIKKGIPENMQRTILQGIALIILVMGISMAFETEKILFVLLSLVIGTILGELMKIEECLGWLGKKLEGFVNSKYSNGGGNVARAFVFASLIYAIGPMAIMGALEDGLTGNYDILLVKSSLDGITAVVFSASMGIGVIFSSITVLIYQGGITLFAGWAEQFLTDVVVNEMTAVGGVLIMGIGINMLELVKIKVGNMLPSIIIIVIFATIFL